MSFEESPLRSPVPAIRSARRDDVTALAALMNRAGTSAEMDDAADHDALAARLEDGRVLIADGDQAPIGAIHIQVQDGIGRLEILAVDPALHGQGIGRRLVDVAELLCRAEGCSQTELARVNLLRDELVGHCRHAGYVPVAASALLRKQLDTQAQELAV